MQIEELERIRAEAKQKLAARGGPIFSGELKPPMPKEVRVVLRNCGLIDPTDITEYIGQDGYFALYKALNMTPEQVIEEGKRSGLRGRGGAGFPAAMKWQLARAEVLKRPEPEDGSPRAYLICNGDEGDPGAFMDRAVLEGDPHSVLEGMCIAAYAMGATQGYIYVRAEYPVAVEHLQTAIPQARALGLLGENIFGKGFDFDVDIRIGAGAFVCGEETALIGSIEGRRGEPRPRPPFPAQSGLWGKPTSVNNVETLANIPQIFLKGANWFASMGTEKSKGTKTFAIAGKVKNAGLIEVPMGITLGEIVFDVGGGIPGEKRFKAVQTGGPLGGCLPAAALNTPIDFDSLVAAGSLMGSGGLIVLDEDTCMVDVARFFMEFTQDESCGKCPPCWLGTKRLLETLTRITRGEGTEDDLKLLAYLTGWISTASLCALGQGSVNPVITTMRHFRQEYEAHVRDKFCEAGVCKSLVRAKCINACPAGVESPAYLALVSAGRYAEGLAIHRQSNPFPLICGRVCPAFCEGKCRRGEIDQPVAIRAVKRFMAAHEYSHPWTPEPVGAPEERRAAAEKKVAIVGAGPAGLTAGLRLAQRGYRVTIFEKLPVPGGMMTVGIPEYRLPREPLFAEIENIARAGVNIECNKSLGHHFTLDSLLEEDRFDAVILAIGAHRSRGLGIPGEDTPGVLRGTEFLREIGLSSAKDTGAAHPTQTVAGQSVAIVGGGDVAIDAARSAWRLGAKQVHVIYRRQREDMPAHKEEIEAAMHEGVRFHFLANPIRVLGDQHVTGIQVQRQRLGEFDSTGRRRPHPVESDEFTMDVDLLISAIGQTIDTSCLKNDSTEITKDGTIKVEDALNTTKAGVFAAGDAVSGPSTVIGAVAQGNQVAVAVDEWLKSGKLAKPHYETPRHDIAQLFNMDDYANAHRPTMPEINVAQRTGNFREVELGYDEHTAQEEARRCLRCDLEWLDWMGIPRPQVDHDLDEEKGASE